MGFFCCSRKGAGHGRTVFEVEASIAAGASVEVNLVGMVFQRESAEVHQAGRTSDSVEGIGDH